MGILKDIGNVTVIYLLCNPHKIAVIREDYRGNY